MESNAMLLPVFAMALLSLAVFVWMYLTRIPAMNQAGMDPQKAQHVAELKSLPNPARQIGDNYNHLFEQPTLFYAVTLAIAVAGHADAIHLACAWGFVALRAVHSLIQCTYNRVMHRFAAFTLSWLLLAVMIVRETIALL